MSDANDNGIDDQVENVVKKNYGKVIAGGSIVAVLVTGSTVAVKWNDLIKVLAAPHIEAAVGVEREKIEIYLNARERQVTCLENLGEPDDCQETYEDAVKESKERLKERE